MSDGLDSFFDMGGYGVFVWPAYALVAALLVWLLVNRIGRLKRRESELARLERARESEPPPAKAASITSAKERA